MTRLIIAMILAAGITYLLFQLMGLLGRLI